MLKKQEEAILEKMKQFNVNNINIEFSDIEDFLNDFYFKHYELNEENIEKFINDDNLEDIVSYMMTQAIIKAE